MGDGIRVGKERKKGEKQNGDIDEGRKEVLEMQCLFTALPRPQVGLFITTSLWAIKIISAPSVRGSWLELYNFYLDNTI